MTECEVNGQLWKLGDVVRLFDGAYGDATIVDLEEETDSGGVVVFADLARPMAYAHTIAGGSCNAQVLLSFERVYHVNVSRLKLAEPRSKYDGKGEPSTRHLEMWKGNHE